MSTVLKQSPKAAAEQPPASTTITHYQDLASQVGATIATAIAQVAPLEAPHPTTRDFVRANAAIETNFIASVIAAVEGTPELQGTKFDVAEARDMLQFVDAFRPLLDQVEILARSLKFTIDARKAKVAEDALHVYALGKRYSRNPNSNVLPHIEIMRRELGRTNPHPRIKPPVPVNGQKEAPAA